MKRSKIYRTALLSVMLLFTVNMLLIPPVRGETGSGNTETIGQVTIPNKGSVAIANVQILQGTEENIVTFLLRLNNTSAAEIDFIDYWIKLRTPSGAVYNPLPVDKAQSGNVPAKTTKTFEMYAVVDKNVSLNGLAFDVIVWDLNYPPDYERILGSVRVPAGYSQVTPAGKNKQLEIAGTLLDTKIVAFDTVQGDSEHEVTIQYEIKNIGQKGVSLPEFVYYIRSREGYLYPMTVNQPEKASIQPKQTLTLEMTAEIPEEVKIDQWTFMVAKKVENLELPVASYTLPKPSVIEEQPPGDSYVYKNKNGSYEIALKSIQRLPWEDEDILAAEFVMTNIDEKKSAPVLKMKAEYLLDGVLIKDGTAEFVTLDNIIGLQPRTSLRFIVLAKIPYTYEFSDIEIVLYEQGSEKDIKISPFTYEKPLNTLRIIEEGMNYRLTDVGRRATIQIKNAQTYEGLDTNIVYTELDITNDEKRMTELTRLHAYFQTEDGTSFPASVSKITGKVAPSGHVLMSVWSEVPKNFTIDDMNLILGQGIAEGKLSTGDKEATAYANAVLMKIADESKELDTDLQDLTIYPYTFSLRKIKLLAVDQTKFKMEFAYDVSKSSFYESIPEKHSLVVEIINGFNKYSKEIAFEEGTEFLEIGQGLRKTIFFEDPELFNNNKFQDYTINLYDQFQGHKKLLATKDLKWYVESE